MALDSDILSQKIHNKAAVHLYDSIDSTNNEAKRRAQTDRGVCLYATTHQTAGRGRRGHGFYSPKDTGLYMTLAFPADNTDIQRLTCAAGVAVCEAVGSLTDRKPQIKWVNDIYIDGKKVAGILAELITDDSNRPISVIVGIGMNLTTDIFPDDIAETAGCIGDIEPEALCAAVTDGLIDLFSDLSDNSVIEKYKSLNLCIGRTVRFMRDGTEHTAQAVDIADDGGLVVEENGVINTLNSGEISVTL